MGSPMAIRVSAKLSGTVSSAAQAKRRWATLHKSRMWTHRSAPYPCFLNCGNESDRLSVNPWLA